MTIDIEAVTARMTLEPEARAVAAATEYLGHTPRRIAWRDVGWGAALVAAAALNAWLGALVWGGA